MKFSVLRALSGYLLLRHDTVLITPFNVVFSLFLISVLCGDNVSSLWFILETILFGVFFKCLDAGQYFSYFYYCFDYS